MRTKKQSKSVAVASDLLPISAAVPVPAYALLGKAIKNTMNALKPGESFEIPKTASKALAYRLTKFPNRTFTIKTEKTKIRIWKL